MSVVFAVNCFRKNNVLECRRTLDNHSFYLDQPQNSTIRKRRKLNFDKMAKHVEILVTYDNSMKEFHADIDVKSYILTLFSYVSSDNKSKTIRMYVEIQVSHLYSDASIGNNIKIWLVKLVELGKNLGVRIT